jgi:hypothetical protein
MEINLDLNVKRQPHKKKTPKRKQVCSILVPTYASRALFRSCKQAGSLKDLHLIRNQLHNGNRPGKSQQTH